MNTAQPVMSALPPRSERPDRRGGTGATTLPTVLGLPVLLWELVFFAVPLLFLVLITFWRVRSFKLEPALSLDNWERVLGSGTFQQALLHTIVISATTAVLVLAIAFPAAYTIALRLPQK